jgi:hypothetical protein
VTDSIVQVMVSIHVNADAHFCCLGLFVAFVSMICVLWGNCNEVLIDLSPCNGLSQSQSCISLIVTLLLFGNT